MCASLIQSALFARLLACFPSLCGAVGVGVGGVCGGVVCVHECRASSCIYRFMSMY